MTQDITLLVDYRGVFYSGTRYPGTGFDIQKLKEYFLVYNFNLSVRSFAEVDFRAKNYNKEVILYQTSEDPWLHYKDYIEDIILGLKQQGAVLIPDFKYFRAHHNKVFLEILRDIIGNKNFKNIKSSHFGTLEEYSKIGNDYEVKVLKSAYTSKSKGVYILDSEKSNLNKVKVIKVKI